MDLSIGVCRNGDVRDTRDQEETCQDNLNVTREKHASTIAALEWCGNRDLLANGGGDRVVRERRVLNYGGTYPVVK